MAPSFFSASSNTLGPAPEGCFAKSGGPDCGLSFSVCISLWAQFQDANPNSSEGKSRTGLTAAAQSQNPRIPADKSAYVGDESCTPCHEGNS